MGALLRLGSIIWSVNRLAAPIVWISPQSLGISGFTASSAPNGNSRFNPYTLYIKCLLFSPVGKLIKKGLVICN